jgi:hypothetical protein
MKKMKKFLYFNLEGDYDGDGLDDAVVYPMDSFMGFSQLAAGTVEMYFKSMMRGDPEGSADAAGSLDNYDKIVITMTDRTKFKEMCQTFFQTVAASRLPMIIMSNEAATGENASSFISSCTLTKAAVYAN